MDCRSLILLARVNARDNLPRQWFLASPGLGKISSVVGDFIGSQTAGERSLPYISRGRSDATSNLPRPALARSLGNPLKSQHHNIDTKFIIKEGLFYLSKVARARSKACF